MCLTAVEVELLVHDIFHGFPVIPAHLAPADVPEFTVENYPISPACKAAVEEGLLKDLAGGLLLEVVERPTHVTALHAKEEKDKVRTICDYSMPEGRSINDHVSVLAGSRNWRSSRYSSSWTSPFVDWLELQFESSQFADRALREPAGLQFEVAPEVATSMWLLRGLVRP